MGLWPRKGPVPTVRCVVASFPPVGVPASLYRRALIVLGVAGLSVASMAVGLGLAFPGGIGSRSGSGAGVSPIYVTPARSQTRPAGAASVARSSRPPTQAPTVSTTKAIRPVGPPPAPTNTTSPSDVVNQVNQQVTDVLDGLVPPQSAGR